MLRETVTASSKAAYTTPPVLKERVMFMDVSCCIYLLHGLYSVSVVACGSLKESRLFFLYMRSRIYCVDKFYYGRFFQTNWTQEKGGIFSFRLCVISKDLRI